MLAFLRINPIYVLVWTKTFGIACDIRDVEFAPISMQATSTRNRNSWARLIPSGNALSAPDPLVLQRFTLSRGDTCSPTQDREEDKMLKLRLSRFSWDLCDVMPGGALSSAFGQIPFWLQDGRREIRLNRERPFRGARLSAPGQYNSPSRRSAPYNRVSSVQQAPVIWASSAFGQKLCPGGFCFCDGLTEHS